MIVVVALLLFATTWTARALAYRCARALGVLWKGLRMGIIRFVRWVRRYNPLPRARTITRRRKPPSLSAM